MSEQPTPQPTEEQLRGMRLTAEILTDFVKDHQTNRAMINLTHEDPKQEALVMVFIGKEQIDKIRPAAERLCPQQVVVNGEQVNQPAKPSINPYEHTDAQ